MLKPFAVSLVKLVGLIKLVILVKLAKKVKLTTAPAVSIASAKANLAAEGSFDNLVGIFPEPIKIEPTTTITFLPYQLNPNQYSIPTSFLP